MSELFVVFKSDYYSQLLWGTETWGSWFLKFCDFIQRKTNQLALWSVYSPKISRCGDNLVKERICLAHSNKWAASMCVFLYCFHHVNMICWPMCTKQQGQQKQNETKLTIVFSYDANWTDISRNFKFAKVRTAKFWPWFSISSHMFFLDNSILSD